MAKGKSAEENQVSSTSSSCFSSSLDLSILKRLAALSRASSTLRPETQLSFCVGSGGVAEPCESDRDQLDYE
jgi:hypothetical protein